MKSAPLIFLIPALLAAQPAPATFTLPNGLKVELFEDHSLPLVRGELRLDLPPPAEDAEAWLRPLGFRMLLAGGSGNRTATAFSSAVDGIGLNIRLNDGPDLALWSFSTRSQDQEMALGLLADQVAHPVFDPLSLEPARLAAWSELSESNALSRARLRFGRSLSYLPEPEERDLATVDTARLSAWHIRLFRPDHTTLVLWGDLDAGQARQLVLLSLGAWTNRSTPTPKSAPSIPESGPFLAALPGEAPSVSIGLVEDGRDRAQRRFLRPWVTTQLSSAGISIEDGEALILHLDAPLGTPAEGLRARLAAALDALPASFREMDLATLRIQSNAEKALMRLHPAALIASASTPGAAPADLAAAKAVLDRWCASTNRRLFASGDPGSLQNLQTATPNR